MLPMVPRSEDTFSKTLKIAVSSILTTFKCLWDSNICYKTAQIWSDIDSVMCRKIDFPQKIFKITTLREQDFCWSIWFKRFCWINFTLFTTIAIKITFSSNRNPKPESLILDFFQSKKWGKMYAFSFEKAKKVDQKACFCTKEADLKFQNCYKNHFFFHPKS